MGGRKPIRNPTQTRGRRRAITQLWGQFKRLTLAALQAHYNIDRNKAEDLWKNYRDALPRNAVPTYYQIGAATSGEIVVDVINAQPGDDEQIESDPDIDNFNPEDAIEDAELAELSKNEEENLQYLLNLREQVQEEALQPELPQEEDKTDGEPPAKKNKSGGKGGPAKKSKPPAEGDQQQPSTSGASTSGEMSAGASAPKRKKGDSTEDGQEEITDSDKRAPGTSDSAGLAGEGGTSGGGGNSFWRGLGGHTHEEDPGYYSKSQRYCRSYHIHGNFADAKPYAAIDFTKTDFGSATTEFNTVVEASCNHGCFSVPYWWRECAMRACDWNVQAHCVGYKIKKFGFEIKNMRMEVLNNDKTNADAVASAPPPEVRMFTFTDSDHSYGMASDNPETVYEHSNFFTDEDARDHTKAGLPVQLNRYFMLPANDAASMLDRGWKQDAPTSNKYTNIDPNYLFNFKRHKSYRETLCKDARMGLEYTPMNVFIPFPRAAIYSPTMTNFIPAVLASKAAWNATAKLTEWPTHHQDGYITNSSGDLNEAKVNYWNQRSLNRDTQDTDVMTANQKRTFASYGKGPIVETWLAAEGDLSSTTYNYRKFKAKDYANAVDCRRTFSGRFAAKMNSERPPLFYFGIYPEYEIQSGSINQWRYYMCAQVEYHCEIEWIFHDGLYPMYWPIGRYGRYAEVTYTGTVATVPANCILRPELLQITAKAKNNGGMHMIDGMACDKPSEGKFVYMR